jgi:hypothetical protein
MRRTAQGQWRVPVLSNLIGEFSGSRACQFLRGRPRVLGHAGSNGHHAFVRSFPDGMVGGQMRKVLKQFRSGKAF